LEPKFNTLDAQIGIAPVQPDLGAQGLQRSNCERQRSEDCLISPTRRIWRPPAFRLLATISSEYDVGFLVQSGIYSIEEFVGTKNLHRNCGRHGQVRVYRAGPPRRCSGTRQDTEHCEGRARLHDLSADVDENRSYIADACPALRMMVRNLDTTKTIGGIPTTNRLGAACGPKPNQGVPDPDAGRNMRLLRLRRRAAVKPTRSCGIAL
jgi:hypothetical protein